MSVIMFPTLLFSIIAIVGFIFWIIMIVDCLKREFDIPTEKVTWILVLLLLNIIGAVFYWFIGRKENQKITLKIQSNE